MPLDWLRALSIVFITPGCLQAFLHLYSPQLSVCGAEGCCAGRTVTLDLGDQHTKRDWGRAARGPVPAPGDTLHRDPSSLGFHPPPAARPGREGGPRRPQATPPDAHWTASRRAPPPAAAGQ